MNFQELKAEIKKTCHILKYKDRKHGDLCVPCEYQIKGIERCEDIVKDAIDKVKCYQHHTPVCKNFPEYCLTYKEELKQELGLGDVE